MYAVNWSDTGHIGIHGRVDVRTDERTDGMPVDDAMAINQNFSHPWITIFLNYGAPRARRSAKNTWFPREIV